MCKVWLIVCSLFLLPISALAEEITSFDSDITVAQDGTFVVTENITYDFGTNDRHGIFRTIPTEHPQESSSWLKHRYVDIALLDVELDGASVPYRDEGSASEFNIRIGDANKTLTGEHMYTLRYRVGGGLSYFNDADPELYWNVTGNNWEVPVRNANARVHGQNGLLTGNVHCYRGAYGTKDACGATIENDAAAFTASNFAAGEGMTVAASLSSDAVARDIRERLSLLWLMPVAGIVWLVLLLVMLYRYRTKHKTGQSIIAQYEPYEDFKPMYTGLLFDDRLDARDITASIVYLAEQGYLKIKKTDRKALFFFEVDDYEITLRRDIDEAVSAHQRDVLGLLFGNTYSAGAQVKLSELKTDTSKQKENAQTLQRLKKDLAADLIDKGFFEQPIRTLAMSLLVIAAVPVAVLAVGVFISSVTFPFVPVGVVGVVLSIVLVAVLHRRRTRKGYEARDYLKGFKEFLSVTDKERFTFHNAPSKSPEQFMEYLPYAIAFGVEKEWAKVFEDVTIPDPEWYDGGTAGAFSAVNLTNSLGAFGSAVTASSGSSPASSGGGFSGGGAGGGGGGSW